MCKKPATRIIRPAWFVRTVTDEQVHKPNARPVPTHMLATAPVFAWHAPATTYQTISKPVVNPAPPTEKPPTTCSVSASVENKALQPTAAPAKTVPPVKFQTRVEPDALTRHATRNKSTITVATLA